MSLQHGNKESSEGCQIPAMDFWIEEQFFKLTRLCVWVYLLKLYFLKLSEFKIISPMETREWDHNSTGSISGVPPIAEKYFTLETNDTLDSYFLTFDCRV
jgi:hypothetical protein